ncbi:hypothetical protein [Arthrobacter bambusae]|uniref:Uncharacterized protein n=1 Tax=Arthrobacter bambusae TaxID=1338426 RepID=A0AAW8DDC8_9MICC|nr:hypothetical protein [Arthrobacter bambusae]MDP9903174.1 hypothetical protein [Arthrobacter bambusae]MDQ0128832.1 hypothetical protein [Arthrobacter bambusae]MDQ0180173.1 hypothetical protein [Arthrobacter bambusae]
MSEGQSPMQRATPAVLNALPDTPPPDSLFDADLHCASSWIHDRSDHLLVFDGNDIPVIQHRIEASVEPSGAA